MNEFSAIGHKSELDPVGYKLPTEAYLSETYAREEATKLWNKVWQAACRVEELKQVGDFVTYDILDESVIIVRNGPDRIEAFHNVCQHRGRRLTKGCGNARQFVCGFHGWRWNIEGKNTFVVNRDDWGSCLSQDEIALPRVQCDTWGGWVWINFDEACEPLLDYLGPAVDLLGPYELDKMRYRWRQWLKFPCNWKVALEAFNESYHAQITHPQLSKWGSTTSRYWCTSQGLHTWHGPAQSTGPGRVGSSPGDSAAPDTPLPQHDPRIATAESLKMLMVEVNSCTTDSIIAAAARLVDELPEGTPAGEVSAHLMKTAIADDAARGIVWPEISVEHMMRAGHDWHIFPNSVILHGQTYALCYRARPDGFDPDSCIFETYVIERYPEGEEPETEWVHVPDPADERWPRVLQQDFGNMPEVQRGMKSMGFSKARPNPRQELTVGHFHQTLASFMGRGAPEPID